MARPPRWSLPDDVSDSGEGPDGLSIEWPEVEEDVDEWSDEEPALDGSPGRIRRAARRVKALASAPFARVARMGAVGFLLVLSVGLLLLKPALMAASRAIELSLPELLSPLMSIRPIEWLAANASAGLAELAGGGAVAIAAAVSLLFLAVLFPLLTTALAQLIPLHVLKRKVSRRWMRIVISLVAMGLLYTLAYGWLGFFVSGVGLGVPLVWAFETQLRRSARRAFLLTFGAHAIANAVIVSLLLFAGAL